GATQVLVPVLVIVSRLYVTPETVIVVPEWLTVGHSTMSDNNAVILTSDIFIISIKQA
ncbi:MAG: hypothetical protein HN586_06175, partial [Oceanospirillaceae bacterium]|nr:hypothetical protein [Oceanospirillaceae bacterium]